MDILKSGYSQLQQGNGGSNVLEDLKQFEAKADTAVANVPLLALPARAVLAGLHYAVFRCNHSRQLGGVVNADIGEAIVQRLSNALPLIRNLQAEPFGAGAEDAIGAFIETDRDGTQLGQLLTYLHFSSLMPEVHRGYFAVDAIDGGFRLRNRDDAFGEGQAKDITLSELAIPFPLEERGRIEPEFRRLAEAAPVIDRVFASRFIAMNAYKYRHGLAEADLITDVSIAPITNRERRLLEVAG